MAKRNYAGYDKLEYDRDLEILLDELDPISTPNNGDSVVFFSTRNHVHYTYLYPLFAKELLDHKVPCYFLFFHPLISETFPDLTLNGIQVTNSLRVQEYPYLYRSGQVGYPIFDWNVDLDNKRVTMEGLADVNLYHPILQTIRKEQRRYNVDFSDPQTSMALQRTLFTADEVFRYLQLLSRMAREQNLTVRFVGWETCYVPHGFLHLYCQSNASPDNFEYIHLSTFYGHYFGEVKSFGSRLGITNLTHRDTHFHFEGFSEEFQEFKDDILASKTKTNEVREEVKTTMKEQTVGPPRVQKNMLEANRLDPFQNAVQEARAKDRQIFALFGHKFYDVGLKDTSPAFNGMCEWIDYVLELFRERDDLLVIKPHPAEINKNDPDMEPQETLLEYVEGKCSDNVFRLKPRDLNSSAIYNLIDCGLVWRSTVGLEMTAFGIPNLVAGNSYYADYVDVHTVESREEFRSKIEDLNQLTIDEQLQTDAAVFFYYFKNKRHFDFDYIKGTNYLDLKPPKIQYDRKLIHQFLDKGDSRIDSMLQEFHLPEAMEKHDDRSGAKQELTHDTLRFETKV